MRCERCGAEVVDGHQCDPNAVEAKRKAREEWRREAEEDRKREALKGPLEEQKRLRPPSIAGPPLARGGVVARQRYGGAKTK